MRNIDCTLHFTFVRFQIHFEMIHVGKATALQDLSLCLSTDPLLYRLRKAFFRLPLLLNGNVYRFCIEALALDKNETSPGEVRAIVLQKDVHYPILTACIKMPIYFSPDGI